MSYPRLITDAVLEMAERNGYADELLMLRRARRELLAGIENADKLIVELQAENMRLKQQLSDCKKSTA